MTWFIFRHVYVVFEVLIATNKNISLVTVKVNCVSWYSYFRASWHNIRKWPTGCNCVG